MSLRESSGTDRQKIAKDMCHCGHTREQHNFKVLPTDPFFHCSGTVFAVTDDPDDHESRETRCSCTSFDLADEWLLEQWGLA